MFNNTYPQTEDTGFNGVPELFNTHLYQLIQGQPEFSDTVMIDASLISDALNPAVLGQNSISQPLIWQELNRLAFLDLQQSGGYRSPDPLYTGEFLYSQNLRTEENLPLSLGTPDVNQSPNVSSSFSQPSLSSSSHQSQLSVSDSCYESTADEMVERLFYRATENLNQTGGDAGIGSCTQSSYHCQTPVSSSVYSSSSEFQPDCPNIPQAVARKSGKRKSKEPIGKSFINYPYNGKTVNTPGGSAKLYRCSQCDFSNARKRNMTRHEKSHDEDRKRWKCNNCEKTYTSKFNLERHTDKCFFLRRQTMPTNNNNNNNNNNA
ncbi:C2H2-type zinc finger transcription factor [Phycomyces blakesleeanus]